MRLMRDRCGEKQGCGGAQEGNRTGEQEVTETLRWLIEHDHGGECCHHDPNESS